MNNALRESVVAYCAKIGQDPLLVQGAGGNVSWKEQGTLWIKASGTWLADANNKDIFVPIDLQHLRSALQIGDYTVKPRPLSESPLRPSIETLLHALMPHRVVAHLHAIEILATLVRIDCFQQIQRIIGDSCSWSAVAYHKPGSELAHAVATALSKHAASNIVFLQNHGIVIGGETVEEVNKTLDSLLQSFRKNNVQSENNCAFSIDESAFIDGYSLIPDTAVQRLALDINLFYRLKSDWALYPDHVVFLGHQAHAYENIQDLNTENAKSKSIKQPELIFVRNAGVFFKNTFNLAKHQQLRCYHDVITRQKSNQTLQALTDTQIAQLLNWDAEHYRASIAQ
jgi:rhamnose utilization protein RhaD (predicted bifunctional aldolase and dehydrogenase)